jgi:hypothetical protein
MNTCSRRMPGYLPAAPPEICPPLHKRASLLIFVKRPFTDKLILAFDGPSPGISVLTAEMKLFGISGTATSLLLV